MFIIFFIRRRDWRALSWSAVAGLAAAAVSVAVFGWNVHRTYLHEILPWTLHGEGMPPYVATASISGVLHRLFLSEPQWNPHPWHSSPLCYALLLPALQMLVLAPAILLIRREDNTRSRMLLEWSALLTASLAISTVPASYNFVLMALPVCVVAALLLQRRAVWVAGSSADRFISAFVFRCPARQDDGASDSAAGVATSADACSASWNLCATMALPDHQKRFARLDSSRVGRRHGHIRGLRRAFHFSSGTRRAAGVCIPVATTGARVSQREAHGQQVQEFAILHLRLADTIW